MSEPAFWSNRFSIIRIIEMNKGVHEGVYIVDTIVRRFMGCGRGFNISKVTIWESCNSISSGLN